MDLPRSDGATDLLEASDDDIEMVPLGGILNEKVKQEDKWFCLQWLVAVPCAQVISPVISIGETEW